MRWRAGRGIGIIIALRLAFFCALLFHVFIHKTFNVEPSEQESLPLAIVAEKPEDLHEPGP
jgi:hypothetical protein